MSRLGLINPSDEISISLQLKKIKLKARSDGDRESALIAAAYAAKKTGDSGKVRGSASVDPLVRAVAALYVDPRGPYLGMAGVDMWDYRRNAMLYDKEHPVVAHPPCGPWSKLRHLYLGKEYPCAPHCVSQVRKAGGVMEHPAGSLLWREATLELPLPGAPPDRFGGFTIEVDQCAYGHVARKKTWVYVIGVARSIVDDGLRTGGTPTHWCSGFRPGGGRKSPARYKQSGGAVPPGIKVCSSQQRRRTPKAFAEWLVSLARASQM